MGKVTNILILDAAEKDTVVSYLETVMWISTFHVSPYWREYDDQGEIDQNDGLWRLSVNCTNEEWKSIQARLGLREVYIF